MNDQLIIDLPELLSERYKRVITLDPAPYFERAYTIPDFSHYKRRNSVQSEIIFPQEDKSICACGCGQKLKGRRRRWATDECHRFSIKVLMIISGEKEIISGIIRELQGGYKCFICGDTDSDLWKKHSRGENGYEKESSVRLELDHIIPVHKGGGCSWLGNYQIICNPCHKKKTRNDLKKVF